ncbi:SET domain-containing protein 5 [Immersiella caudata]|uniref:SET domain-containing protein 5 n=1 Tax=Immersiella caudata TaxID=314043 RepID=A0AA39X5Z0_9PEZI|nr:SET domain-containing protein 5 [Immersiella caudata]
MGEMQRSITGSDQTRGTQSSHNTPPVSLSPSQLDAPTNLPQLYHIRSLQGKGQAMIAACNIPKGTRILCESPTITLPGNSHDSASALLLAQLITTQLSNLPAITNKHFHTLHNNYPPPTPAAVGICKTNALPLSHESLSAGVFLTASRINHSCAPNAQNIWNASLGKITIHAVRDIDADSEITISYLEPFLPRPERRAKLASAFGFDCVCKRCAVPPAQIKQSDARVERLVKLDGEISDGHRAVRDPLGCLWKIKEMLGLLEKERLGGSMVLRAYYDAFQVVIANGKEARAKVFAERWYASVIVVEGEGTKDAVRAKRMVERPAVHVLFGMGMRWKQGAGKIPRGLGEEEFGKWLWREKVGV